MKIIGLTGGIGAGKSSILKLFSKKNIPYFKSDDVARDLMNFELKSKIQKEFSNDLYKEGLLNTYKLSRIVFNSPSRLEKLNSIVHPAVHESFNLFLKEKAKYKFVIKETAILFETSAYKKCDVVILICAPIEERIKRVVLRDGISRAKVLDRIKNQWADEKKIMLSDYIINNVEWENTLIQFESIFGCL